MTYVRFSAPIMAAFGGELSFFDPYSCVCPQESLLSYDLLFTQVLAMVYSPVLVFQYFLRLVAFDFLVSSSGFITLASTWRQILGLVTPCFLPRLCRV